MRLERFYHVFSLGIACYSEDFLTKILYPSKMSGAPCIVMALDRKGVCGSPTNSSTAAK